MDEIQLKNFKNLTTQYIRAKKSVDDWWSKDSELRNSDEGKLFWDNFKEITDDREMLMRKMGLLESLKK